MRNLSLVIFLLSFSSVICASDMQKQVRDIHAYQHVIPTRIGLLEAMIHSFTHKDALDLVRRSQALEQQNGMRLKATVLAIFTLIEHGFDSKKGQDIVNRINCRHQIYGADEKSDAKVHTLSCFVVGTIRSIERFSPASDLKNEKAAIVWFYQELGQKLGMESIPNDYQAFCDVFDTNFASFNELTDEDIEYARNLANISLKSSVQYFFKLTHSWFLLLAPSIEKIILMEFFDERTRELMQCEDAEKDCLKLWLPGYWLNKNYFKLFGRFETPQN